MVMEGGLGADSYCLNSGLQARGFSELSPAITEAIKKSIGLLATFKLIRIADIGCSSGTNTIAAVEFVINEIRKEAKESQQEELTFQVFFSDLHHNDFNTLFSLLHGQVKSYFYGAVPGSFCDRLFPTASIHFAMSNFALHWLSKIPDEILDESSPAWNAGRVFVDTHSSKEALDAFAHQAHEDFCLFLKHRAEEIVAGGILSCFLMGRSSDESLWHPGFQAAWEELVAEGLVKQETMDSFNVPVYRRTVDEVEKAVQETGSFEALRIEFTEHVPLDPADGDYASRIVRNWKAVTKQLVEQQFGGDEELVQLLYKKMEARIRSFPVDQVVSLTAILVRV